MARKPANREIGRHILKGLRFDINGNPLYTCDTFSNEVAKAIGWRFSPKYGLYGQFPIVSDPTIFNESKNTIRLTESESTSIETLMATAASYMEDFDLGKYAEAVYCWENYTKSYILGCLKMAIQQAHKLMTQRVDDADDYLNAVHKAYTTFANMKEASNESKNMNRKNTIRLTESELKNIITESVKNIISELDWKTYQMLDAKQIKRENTIEH